MVKNRLHLDVQVGGGRDTPWETWWPRVVAATERLTVLRRYDFRGRPDHVVLADPEENEFCLVTVDPRRGWLIVSGR
ncbi:VOC family protein [Amycolatopsis samaneae]|uniref:VOC family protein n=1 Tax=Amycolatopsis samaneae TaxID=664691 RepID=A0ABW5GAJ6_9PSEU